MCVTFSVMETRHFSRSTLAGRTVSSICCGNTNTVLTESTKDWLMSSYEVYKLNLGFLNAICAT